MSGSILTEEMASLLDLESFFRATSLGLGVGGHLAYVKYMLSNIFFLKLGLGLHHFKHHSVVLKLQFGLVLGLGSYLP